MSAPSPTGPTPAARATTPTRRQFVAGLGLLGVGGVLAACSSSDDSGSESGSGAGDDRGSASDDSSTTTSLPPTGRIVVLGEEYLLADLLALGIVPTASTATVVDAGFQGLDDHDTSGVRALNATERNLELLASLQPDHIITLEFFANELGPDTLRSMAELTVIPDGLPPEELVTRYGEMFGRQERAAELVADYESASTRAASALGGKQVSVVAVYAGPSVAAFVDGPWAVPQTLLNAGATLVPSPAEAEPDRNGRAYLSMERLDLLSAPQMVTLQTDLVEGESESVAALEQDPLWTSLPAVASGQVLELDRLAYPGIEGRIRLIDDLIAGLG
jgi:iron complex transport system substrate-binding protein